ncbi:uroporphyrinogen-III C-methyltransferase [Litorilinea aerophila]|uniref:uroporphyrinogen-III C-methyltransferase n=1 Tax=Litorilinea aerophila TaxID=1204385 RepID=A0A540VM24_9CHLR|nr:uroporphyrinogen-III C-methyltransferase [Litorilinea aerophila]MCC9074507.1 uroporphyrinogen-III C-methyltransferase [Litorilinea aerophila]GIV75651.1 MAG: uroporphyrin-III C-methyltransferase [Litorilinea sp.]
MKTISFAARRYGGKAYIVGAGPGRADLITVRGLRLLQQADVVIYDRLIAQELLDEIRPDAERIFVGKGPDHHTLEQDAINALLVERVRAGYQVVRLKGGDPFVFGRGGEEALALQQAGLPYEVVPGITSAVAVPAYAGIPVTHRGISTSFAVVTGHECRGREQSMTDWEALARIPTLVVLMGVRQIEQIAARLMAAGRGGDTPAAAISWGTTDEQQVVRSTLAQLAGAMAEAGLTSPAVIVIGEVAALHDELAWFRAQGDAAGFLPLADAEARPMLAALGT